MSIFEAYFSAQSHLGNNKLWTIVGGMHHAAMSRNARLERFSNHWNAECFVQHPEINNSTADNREPQLLEIVKGKQVLPACRFGLSNDLLPL
jgi:hypothetical protein